MVPRPGLQWTKARRREQNDYRDIGSTDAGLGMFLSPEKRTSDKAGLDWMALVDGNTLLSDLTIPGTHDSAAYTSSLPFIATQTMDFQQQLDVGIRYFDLRCGVRNDIVELVHGPTFLGLRLEEVLGVMYAWLHRYPTEALIVQVKQDRKPQKSSMHFSHAIWKVMAPHTKHWRTADDVPTLDELRGRIQLFRRFQGPSFFPYGTDVSRWQDNPSKPFTIHSPNGVEITVQDHYNFTEPEPLPSLIAKKGGNVSELLELASHDRDDGHWYINFTSAYELNLWYQLPHREIALGGYWGFHWEAGMNARLQGYLSETEGTRNRFGIVAMDFPSEDLIFALIQSNYEPDKPLLCMWTWTLLATSIISLAVFAWWAVQNISVDAFASLCPLQVHSP